MRHPRQHPKQRARLPRDLLDSLERLYRALDVDPIPESSRSPPARQIFVPYGRPSADLLGYRFVKGGNSVRAYAEMRDSSEYLGWLPYRAVRPVYDCVAVHGEFEMPFRTKIIFTT